MVHPSEPEVSVIVPCYNGEETLERCLVALAEQIGAPAFEVIVADDASTDASREIALRHADRVVESSDRGGAGRARNAGAAVARGQVLAFTDADCVPGQDWLSNLVGALDERGVAAAGGGYSHPIDPTVVGRFNFLELQWRRRLWTGSRASCLSNNLALHREHFFAVGGFPVHMRYSSAEDLVLTYRVSLRGKVYWLRDNGVGHHFRAGLWSYLAQQYRFALPMPYLYLRSPGMLTASTHHHKGGFISLASLPAGLLLAVGMGMGNLVVLLTAVVFLLVSLWPDAGFVGFLKREGGGRLAIIGLGLIALRNGSWFLAGIAGIPEGIVGPRRAEDDASLKGLN